MILYAEKFSINFQDISESKLLEMPDYLQPVAELILRWQNGDKEFLLHTSGSTGKPKPILLEREKIIYSAKLTAQTFGLQRNETLLCCLGTNYIAGFIMVMRALVLECNLFVSPAKGNPLHNVDKKIDFAAFVPLQLNSIFGTGEKCFNKLNDMKAVIIGGAAVSPVLENKLQLLEVPVFHTYSMTETYTHIAIRRLNGEEKSEFFSPLKDVLISTDNRGCLLVKSPITDMKTLTTNDLVDLNEDGSFLLKGRIDNVINSGGVKIQLEEIEMAAKKVFREMKIAETELFAYGIPDEKLGEKLILLIEDEFWEKSIIENFSTQLNEICSGYKMPKELYFIKAFLLTETGKTDRQKTIKALFEKK